MSAPLLGGYGREATRGLVRPAAITAAKVWALATPLGLVFRGLSRGYVPPVPFVIVSLVATAVVMVGWRSAYAAIVSEVRAGLEGGARVVVWAGMSSSSSCPHTVIIKMLVCTWSKH